MWNGDFGLAHDLVTPGFAGHWPGWLWLIVGLKGDEPDNRLWRIEGGEVEQVELVVQ